MNSREIVFSLSGIFLADRSIEEAFIAAIASGRNLGLAGSASNCCFADQ